MNVYKKVCINCGKFFETTTRVKIYCSDHCSDTRWRISHGPIKQRKEYNESISKEYFLLKKLAYEILGNKCIVCGYTGVALQIDHINGGGYREAKRIGTVGYYKKIILGSKDYQLLCANHNWEKRIEKHEYIKKREYD